MFPMHKHNRKDRLVYISVAEMFIKVLSTLLWLIHQFISLVWISRNEKRKFFQRNRTTFLCCRLYPISILSFDWTGVHRLQEFGFFDERTITNCAERNCKSLEIETTFIRIRLLVCKTLKSIVVIFYSLSFHSVDSMVKQSTSNGKEKNSKRATTTNGN